MNWKVHIPGSTAADLSLAAREAKFEPFTAAESEALREALKVVRPLAKIVAENGWDELRKQRDAKRAKLVTPDAETASAIKETDYCHASVEAAAVEKRKAAKRALKHAMSQRVAPVCAAALRRFVTWLESLVAAETEANLARSRRYGLACTDSALLLELKGRVVSARLQLDSAEAVAAGKSAIIGARMPWLEAFGGLCPEEFRP